MKKINTNGDCKPDLHYMVNIESRLKAIRAMVHNRDYVVLSLDFQKLSYDDFLTEQSFSETLVREILQKQSLLKTFRRRFWYRCRNGKADSAA